MRSVLLLTLLGALPASAQLLQDRGPPPQRFVHRSTVALRYNPLGLLYDGRFSYRFRLYESSSVALRDNFVGFGLAPTASPAFLKVGPYVEFNPLTVLGLWAAFQRAQYFGTFGLLQGFPSAASDFDDTTLRARADSRLPTSGWELTLGANLQLKAGPLVLRDMARAVYGAYALREGDRVYYDQFYDVGAPNNGWFVVNDVDVLWQGAEGKLLAGARWTWTQPLYGPEHFDPSGPSSADNAMHRVGPFLAYTFRSEDGARWNNPTAFLLLQWWVKHRFRTGADTPQALPLVGVGFQVSGDFLPLD
ncbi:MAG: hypothetical protein RL653_2065 [Pseudomonadota bacterium]|jgi:hypothetical protein